MKLPSEIIGRSLEFPAVPRRIISLNAAFTEALLRMGFRDSLVGVSAYCSRYADCSDIPVAGDYLQINRDALNALQPDLILMTGGIQLRPARVLASEGYPVHVIPLPSSVGAICDSYVQLAALCGDAGAGRDLADSVYRSLYRLRDQWQGHHPRCYTEIWFGQHPRMIGGISFIHDILWFAGLDPVFGREPWPYHELDLDMAAGEKPEVFLGFSEPEYPVDFVQLSRERGWMADFSPTVIVSDITAGRNIIHDGPSLVQTASWLQEMVRSTLH